MKTAYIERKKQGFPLMCVSRDMEDASLISTDSSAMAGVAKKSFLHLAIIQTRSPTVAT